jgi:hypothetical protein
MIRNAMYTSQISTRFVVSIVSTTSRKVGRISWLLSAHAFLHGWSNRLANPIALNSAFVPVDPAADFLLRDRETIFNFQGSL